MQINYPVKKRECWPCSHVWLLVTSWTRLLCSQNSPWRNTGMGSQSHLQGIFPTQGWNLSLLHSKQILYHLSHQEAPKSYLRQLLYKHSILFGIKWNGQKCGCGNILRTPEHSVHQASKWLRGRAGQVRKSAFVSFLQGSFLAW